MVRMLGMASSNGVWVVGGEHGDRAYVGFTVNRMACCLVSKPW